MKVLLSPDGTIEVQALDGSFAEASESVRNLLANLGASGVELSDQSEPEQHAHGKEEHVAHHAHNRS
jgi:hypothetical protein